VTLGSAFEFSGPDNITVGKTTQADLIAKYGRPFRVGFDNGSVKWAYSYYHYSLLGDPEIQDLDIIFDKGGAVASYTYESTAASQAPKPAF
jgi:hypothetical protein